MRSKKRHLNALKTGSRIHWYKIIDILGQGGFGITYLAEDTNLHHEVAIKEYLPTDLAIRVKDGEVHPVSQEQYDRYNWGLERFLEEAQTLGQFKHPNIVRVRNVFKFNNTAYMVMDYELGESFQEILNRRKTLEEEDIKTIIYPIIDGMKIVHAAGFIHRDIKPANIFLRVDGDPVLLDFGSARQSFVEDNQSLTSIFSRGYAPIEQYHSSEESQGPWTDIYALGATLYRAIVGIPPTDAVDRSAAIAQISKDTYVSAREIGEGRYSDELLTAIDYALAFRQQDRPQTVSEWRYVFDITETGAVKNKQEQTDLLSSNIQAAEAGDADAQSKLAYMYTKGISTEKNELEAIDWYLKAAEQGHVISQYNLGVIFAKGRGVEQDFHTALKWYELAATKGDVISQATLGMMYTRGVGADADLEKAYYWYLKAAEQNHVNAQYCVAECYAWGRGVSVDETESINWYKKAAEKGHSNAQMKLAYMYGKGKGIKRDDTEAFHWFRKAAEQGHPKAQYNLGVIYAKGRGVTKNINEAKKWYELARAQGEENSERALAKLGA